MTALQLFEALHDRIPEAIEAEYGANTNCILATRVAIEVATHFRIEVRPMAVRAMLFNAPFVKHVQEGDPDVRKWEPIDGSYSVGIGYGYQPGQSSYKRWDGHLIAVADGCFGDFSIQQAERPLLGLITGRAIVGPLRYDPRLGSPWDKWFLVDPVHGTAIHYERKDDESYRLAADWRDEARRRKLAGPLIRALRPDVHSQV